MNNTLKFGENVQGFDVPVLNEREIRAAAGLLFLLMFISILVVIFRGNFLLFKYAVTIFFTDMIIRVFVSPKFSPALITGRLIVRNQVPEYVGAPQKKFAWLIGMVLSATIFVLVVILNSYSPISGIICFTCLIFLFFETAFGICLGCKFYPLFYKEKALYCSGEVCEIKSKHEIQRTSWLQMLIVIGFIGYMFLAGALLNDVFSKKPHALFGAESSMAEIKNEK